MLLFFLLLYVCCRGTVSIWLNEYIYKAAMDPQLCLQSDGLTGLTHNLHPRIELCHLRWCRFQFVMQGEPGQNTRQRTDAKLNGYVIVLGFQHTEKIVRTVQTDTGIRLDQARF